MSCPTYRRISQGNHKPSGNGPIALLRDLDQPFIFELRGRVAQYRLEFSDTSSPENWQLLRPDIVIICYDISQRLSLINMKRIVRTFIAPPITSHMQSHNSSIMTPNARPVT